MKFLSRWFGKKTKNPAPKTAKGSTERKFAPDFKAFILEPILTPSALIDGGEEMPDPAMLDELDLPWLAALDAIEQATDEPPELFTSGTFEVGESGEIEFEFLYDGGGYEGELAIFSLEGMEEYEPGSREFIQEAARRSLSESEWGHIVIKDRSEGAKFEGDLGEWNFNQGEYTGTKTFQMRPGDRFGAMLVPKGEVTEVFDNPDIGGAKRPLFSLSTANPEDGLQTGQIADVDGNGQTFVFEDLRVDGKSDRDYNDIIFRVKGAEGEAIELDEVIAENRDWRETELGQEILDYVKIDPPIAEEAGEILILSDRQDWGEVVTEAVNQTADILWEFVQQENFSEEVQLTFGEQVEIEAAREAIVELIAGRDFPPIQIVTQGELGEANAGFGIESNTIYLSHTFVETHLENPEIVSEILLEELGHFLDVKLESEDALGDEGAIFASVATGEELDETQLQALQKESDRTAISLNGETITLEQNSNGTGLLATYYDNPDFSNPVASRVDPSIAFLWGLGSPHSAVESDRFSVKWRGQIEPRYGETYTFTTRSDDGVRLKINGQLIIDDWNSGPERVNQGIITLEAGQKYEIELDYYEETAEAKLELLWESPNQPQEIVPTSQLYPGEIALPLGVDGTGTGLQGTYYDNPHFSEPVLSRIDEQVDFEWGDNAPDEALEADTFSARWTGKIEALYDEEYTFITQSDDGVRLKVNGEVLIDDWTSRPKRENQGKIVLEAGKEYDIELDYYEDALHAEVKLLWQSQHQTREVIPSRFLHPQQPPLPENVEGDGTGLKGEYFNDKDFTDLALERTDSEIDFEWGDDAPDAALEADTYSVRWTGQIEALYDEEYTFYTQSDDGVRLWVNEQLLIDDWTARPERENQGKIVLEGGKKYDIKLEYFEEGLTAISKLLWSSSSQTKEVIPASQLISENPDCAPITAGWSQVLDIVEPGAYTFDINLPFGTTFTVNGETFNTTPEDNSFSLLLPAGAIDFQLQMPAISPCDPPWMDGPENDGGPPIDIGVTSPDGRRQIGTIQGGWLTNEGPDSGTGGDDGGWWNIDWPPLDPVDPGTNEPPPASGDEPPGTGLYAQYFKGTTFSNLAYAKFVPNVYEDWDYKGPLWDDSWLDDEVRLNVEGDNFGIRYTGQIKAPDDGEYKFSMKQLDESARLWINGELVMDAKRNEDIENNEPNYGEISESISLKAGQKYNFQLDFVEELGEASAFLHWEKDGGEVIPVGTEHLYPTMPPGMLLVNDEPTPVLVGKSAAAASLLSQYFYEDYESVRVTVRDRSPVESAAFLDMPAGDVLWSQTLSKSEVLGSSSYLEIAQKNYEEMFGSDLPERDRLYGTHLAVEYELLDENGNGVLIGDRAPGRFNDNFYVYRWIDAVGATEAFWGNGSTIAFHEKDKEKIEKNLGKSTIDKTIDFFFPNSLTTTFEGNNPDFQYGSTFSGNQVGQFDYVSSIPLNEQINNVEDSVKILANGISVGSLKSILSPIPDYLEAYKYSLKIIGEAYDFYDGVATNFLGKDPGVRSGLEPWEVRSDGYDEKQRQWALKVIIDNSAYIFDVALAYNITPDAIAGAILWEALENPYNAWGRGLNPLLMWTRPGGYEYSFGIPGKIHTQDYSEAALAESLVRQRRAEPARYATDGIEYAQIYGSRDALGNRINDPFLTDDYKGEYPLPIKFLTRQEYRTHTLLKDPTLAIEYVGAILGRAAGIYENIVEFATGRTDFSIRDQAGILGILYQGGIENRRDSILQNFLNDPYYIPQFSANEAMGPWISEYRWWIRRLLAAYSTPPYRFTKDQQPVPGSVGDVEIPYQFRLQPYQIW